MTLSSSMAQLDRLAVDARAPDKPLGPFDTAQFAYKVSKTGLNQGALRAEKIWLCCTLLPAQRRMRCRCSERNTVQVRT